MEKKSAPYLIIGIIVALLFAILVFMKLNGDNTPAPTEYNEVSPSADLAVDFETQPAYLFTSVTCPHCENVKDYLQTQPGLADQVGLINVSMDDVMSQATRQAQLTEFATICGLDTKMVGIPFLYLNQEEVATTERCLIGDTPIIDYLKANQE